MGDSKASLSAAMKIKGGINKPKEKEVWIPVRKEPVNGKQSVRIGMPCTNKFAVLDDSSAVGAGIGDHVELCNIEATLRENQRGEGALRALSYARHKENKVFNFLAYGKEWRTNSDIALCAHIYVMWDLVKHRVEIIRRIQQLLYCKEVNMVEGQV
ncbi:hypothetical protein Ancab_012235 [Ancistrocladus abbreviatus]